MSLSRFDAWTKTVATTGLSRRTGLRLTLSAGVAALVGQAVVEEAAACRRDGRPCSRPGQCCSGKCKGSGDNKQCRRAKQAFGCTVNQDSCRRDIQRPCPNRPNGFCVVLDSGEAFCAGEGECEPCRKGSDCPSIPGAGKPKCITNCRACQSETNGKACVYPNAPL